MHAPSFSQSVGTYCDKERASIFIVLLLQLTTCDSIDLVKMHDVEVVIFRNQSWSSVLAP
ncbi:hypothetical protein AGR7C_pTi0055 [Agrobacterium deltaense Zutra 3/1]|uniref:Uncharacterized protein n=1 Tax=Agrobacterium deltaense Zutra 3/1 TaxID=1183427 RepID=A0A1S7S5B1_9HYPH|nr:hypothetical protein AGR7C_pTi0055 [Agrobacterium deltaense Zutra 3/1]